VSAGVRVPPDPAWASRLLSTRSHPQHTSTPLLSLLELWGRRWLLSQCPLAGPQRSVAQRSAHVFCGPLPVLLGPLGLFGSFMDSVLWSGRSPGAPRWPPYSGLPHTQSAIFLQCRGQTQGSIRAENTPSAVPLRPAAGPHEAGLSILPCVPRALVLSQGAAVPYWGGFGPVFF
jgi:hypothetical protein